MILDSQWSFISPGSPLSLVAGAGISIPSTNTIDLLGQGVGTAPVNIIGNTSVFGMDVGIGGLRPQLICAIGTLPVTADSCTLNLAFQAAEDNGSYQPSTWQTLVETGALTVSQLAAGTIFARFDFPPAFPANLSPRFLRLLAQVPSGEYFTAGTIAYATVTMVRDDQANKFAANNYKVA